jgi:hypothetical protein
VGRVSVGADVVDCEGGTAGLVGGGGVVWVVGVVLGGGCVVWGGGVVWVWDGCVSAAGCSGSAQFEHQRASGRFSVPHFEQRFVAGCVIVLLQWGLPHGITQSKSRIGW